jgi:hypothetical protein
VKDALLVERVVVLADGEIEGTLKPGEMQEVAREIRTGR